MLRPMPGPEPKTTRAPCLAAFSSSVSFLAGALDIFFFLLFLVLFFPFIPYLWVGFWGEGSCGMVILLVLLQGLVKEGTSEVIGCSGGREGGRGEDGMKIRTEGSVLNGFVT